MSIERPISLLIKTWLEYDGFSSEKINSYSNETALLHDLDIYGDDAYELFIILREKFGVDMTNFDDFRKYFPSEGSLIIGALSWLKLFRFGRKHSFFEGIIINKYPRLTLGMIEVTLEKKKWCY